MLIRKLIAIIVLVLFVSSAPAQFRRQRNDPFGVPPGECAPNDQICLDRKHKREIEQNKARQADLKRDTDKLYQLATELKASVDKTDENMLSLEVVKKAEEIEKLAHDVKKKMKGE